MEPDPNFCGSGGIGRDALAGALSDESARILKQYLEVNEWCNDMIE